MIKDLGAAVSGHLDPEGRNWETTVYQAGKPVLDTELNLVQDTEQDTEFRIRRRILPSGWVSGDFLDTSDMTSAIFTQSATANELEIPQDLQAHVNGWPLRVGHTNANGSNILDLGAGPSGAGTKRTDMVILEVWRRLLAPSPSTVGKSGSGRIWWQGNVKVDAADDMTLNFADDILDGAVGAETTKRVQIQYRLRVVPGVDILAYPTGLDDSVVANSVPASAAAPNGTATAFNYANQSANGDPGLWRAGDGDPSNTLGTVDGYMYAIPLMAVVRRNITAFSRNANHNGGVASPGPSDRPDGLFHDIIVPQDVLDLRMGVSPTGWDYGEILEKNFNWLLDNITRTEWTNTLVGGGLHGHTVLTADEIGVSNANGGDGTTTGDTPGAVFIGEFDAARRSFSDRSITEIVPLRFTPADSTGGGPNWQVGDELTIDPTALPIYPYSAFNWAAYAPADFTIPLVFDGVFMGNGAGEVRAGWNPTSVTISGLGAVPQGSLTVTLGASAIPVGVTDEDLIINIVISYPTGVGLSKTPTDDFGAASVSINNPGQLPAGAPILYDGIENQDFDYAHRELFLTYQTDDQVISFSGPLAGQPEDIIIFPERVLSISDIEINTVPYGGSVTISDDGFSAALDAMSFTTGDEATVTFRAVRPFPQNDEQITVYYESRAPQTIRDGLCPAAIDIVPKCVSSYAHSLITGSGSLDEAFPFPYQYVQMPGVYPTSGGTFSGDHEFASVGEVVLNTLQTNTGYVRLPLFVGYVPNPQEASFERIGGDVDAEGRSYYKSTPAGYRPFSIAQSLQGGKVHRAVLPFLAELPEDSDVGKKGQLVLAVLSTLYKDGPAISSNAVGMLSDLAINTGSLSLYRLRGNLLNRRSI